MNNIKFSRIFIFGVPLSGKTTQCKILSNKFLLNLISAKDILSYAQPAYNLLLDKNILKNIFITDHIILKMQENYKKKIFIFDNFPNFFYNLNNISIDRYSDVFINIRINFEILAERLKYNFLCFKCQEFYDTKYFYRCKICNSENIDSYRNRYFKFEKMYSKSLQEIYNFKNYLIKNYNIKFYEISGDYDKMQIFENIKKILI